MNLVRTDALLLADAETNFNREWPTFRSGSLSVLWHAAGKCSVREDPIIP